jgi:hypothetical protein
VPYLGRFLNLCTPAHLAPLVGQDGPVTNPEAFRSWRQLLRQNLSRDDLRTRHVIVGEEGRGTGAAGERGEGAEGSVLRAAGFLRFFTRASKTNSASMARQRFRTDTGRDK